MFFSRSLLLAAIAAPLAVFAQNGPNSFNVPAGGYNATAGQSLSLSWTPTTGGTVSLVLRQGASSNLEAGSIIATNITNSGSYTWSIPADTVRGSDYTVEIVDDQNNSLINFTPYFVLESTVTVATTTSLVGLGATASGTASGSASTKASTATGSSSGSASTTGTATSHSSSSAASTSSATTTTHAATPVSTNAGPRATAAVGFLGAIALGALAL